MQPARQYHFCTYFDYKFLARGLALYYSLAQHCQQPFTFWMLCFDDETHKILDALNLPGVRLIARQEFEEGDGALAQAKSNRNQIEYYWTCTPALMLFVLEHNPDVGMLTYLDADLYFYSDPQPMFDELGDGSILIIGHRFTPEWIHLEKFGIYNVGTLIFRRDANGLACLSWWRERCLEWCYAREEDGKFGDQKYLDEFPARFQGVVVSEHKGTGLAPWNVANYRLTAHASEVFVDADPLVFYHFHGIHILCARLFSEYMLSYYGIRQATRELRALIYAPYVRELHRVIQQIHRLFPGAENPYVKYGWRTWLEQLARRRLICVAGSSVWW